MFGPIRTVMKPFSRIHSGSQPLCRSISDQINHYPSSEKGFHCRTTGSSLLVTHLREPKNHKKNSKMDHTQFITNPSKAKIPNHPAIAFLSQLTGMKHAKKRVAKDNPQWTADEVDNGFKEYLKFWILKRKLGLTTHIPMLSDTVDQFWHAHILHTVLYQRECQVFFNDFLHHQPYTTLTQSETKQRFSDGVKAFDVFQRAYQEEFGYPLTQPWHDAIEFIEKQKNKSI